MSLVYRLDVLGLHEFDSVRKRMSVVIRFPDNAVKVLVKGADTSMFSILENGSESNNNIWHATQSHLNEYSSQGLRTLVVASRDLSGAEHEEWQSRYEEASTSLTDRLQNMDRSCIKVLRISDEYQNRFESFLHFTQENGSTLGGKYFCPCVKCVNGRC